MITARINIDPAMKEMEKNLKELSKMSVAVGVLSGAGTYKNGTEITTIASVHEFGAPHKNIPQRSFLRVPFAHEKIRLNKVIDKSFMALANGKISVKSAYDIIGAEARNIVIKAFSTSGFGKWEGNSNITVAKKGSSKPLIDTGRLMQSITWEVRHD